MHSSRCGWLLTISIVCLSCLYSYACGGQEVQYLLWSWQKLYWELLSGACCELCSTPGQPAAAVVSLHAIVLVNDNIFITVVCDLRRGTRVVVLGAVP